MAFEIDLSEDNAEALRAEFERYVQAGRRIGGRRTKVALGQSALAAGHAATESVRGNSREYNQQVREWATANGHEVAERGRLSKELIELYEAALAEPAPVEEPAPAAKPSRRRSLRKKAAK